MIPPIVHTLWPGADPFRPEFCEWRKTWLRHNPDWSLRFWRTEPTGNARVDRILRSPEYTPVFKSDVLRWLALLQHGGLYADADIECLRACEALLVAAPSGFFCAYEPPWPKRDWESDQAPRMLSNAILGAIPRHPFVRDMLEGILQRAERASVDECNTPGAGNRVGGPIALTSCAENRGEVTIVPSHWFFPEAKDNDEALRAIAFGEQPAYVELGDAFTRHHWNAGTRGGHDKMLASWGSGAKM